jgi:YVTN family beta-propeller protein
VYVANTTNNTVSVKSTATNTVVATVPVGINPAFIAFGTQGHDPIDSLIAQVEALITAGTLTENQGAGLIDKLEEVSTKLDSGQSSAVCNQLNALTNQVNSFIKNHSLTQAQGKCSLRQ